MSSILQKIRHANHLLLLHKCTSDDNIPVSVDVISKLSSITYDGSISSRFIAMTLFEKLTKRSSTLSLKILPVICSVIRNGSSDFEQEIRQKLYILKQLQGSSLKCQGEQVHGLFKELIELLEGDKCNGLLEGNELKCLTLSDVKMSNLPIITDSLSINVVSPEVNIVQQITAPSCIDILPPMVDIWKFSNSYKNLNQNRVNDALLDVLQNNPSSAKLKALAVLDYLTQQFPDSLGNTFNSVVDDILQSDNIDLRTKAKNVHNKLMQRPLSRATSSVCSSSPRPEEERDVEEENLCTSHLKKSYDKIAIPQTRYKDDDALLDLSGLGLAAEQDAGFLSGVFASSRRSSASSSDFLLEPNC